jgi:maltooligosyltrehalose trehalohydrolase
LRRSDPTFSKQERGAVDGAVLGPHSFLLRFFDSLGKDDRLLVINLGPAVTLEVAPEPLLAPTDDEHGWETLWSSEQPRYGGPGMLPLETETGWNLPAESAAALQPGARLLETKA